MAKVVKKVKATVKKVKIDRKPAAKVKAKVKAKAKPEVKAKKVVKSAPAKTFFKPKFDDLMDGIEKKFKLGHGIISEEAKRSSVMSTGIISTDIMIGGGIYPGLWYTCFGGEGSAKSTQLMHIKAAAAESGVPILADYDFEGATAASPEYFENILHNMGIKRNFKDVFGEKDAKGKWVTTPLIRPYNVSTAEEFFNPAASLLRALPDKEFRDNRWFYVYDADKAGRAATQGKHSKSLFTETGRLYLEAEDGKPQAIFFLDSYPAMFPDRLDADDAGAGMAAVARSFSENCPKVGPKLRRKGVTIVGVNQLRLRPAFAMGNPEYEPAGETIKFWSSCRIRQAARALSGAPYSPVDEEASVLGEGLNDNYKFIHMKTIKNKTFAPYQESWQRVWCNNGLGEGSGFDPVWDAFYAGKQTGQIGGSYKKMQLNFPHLKTKTITWDDFKRLVLLKGKLLKQHCGELGIAKDPKIREHLFAQVASGKAHELYFEQKREEADEEEEDDGDDE